MNRYVVETFRKRLEDFSISDYHGLISPGLTCYLNCVLQVLFMTEDFREAVKRSCSKDPATIDRYLRELFGSLEKRMAKTHKLTKKLGITDVYEQRDVAEYFEKILCLTSPEASKIFKGELSHKTTCCRCNKGNDSRSFFWILPLAVEDSFCRTYDVEEGFKSYFNVQKVSGENQVYCSQCSKKQDADTVWELTQHPDVLTLLLKRFTFDYKRKCYVKLHCKADVPQTLYTKTCTYDLFAVVNHFGNLTGGHYTAEIKSFETGQWYCFDDDSVRRVKSHPFGIGVNSLRSCAAYLLMYRKISGHPEKADGSDREAQGAHSDAEVEGRRDEAEGGEALGPHYQLKGASCRGGGENFKHLNGDILDKSHDDALGRRQKNSSLGDKLLNHRASPLRHPTNMLPQTDNEADGDNYSPNLGCSSTKTAVESNSVKIEREVVTLRSSVKQGREANGSGMSDSSAKPCHASSHGYPSASDIQLTRRSCRPRRGNEPTECSPNVCRKSSSSRRNKEKQQHVVHADSSCKPEATQTVEENRRGKREAKKCEDKAKKNPWK
ncbi:putative ubiquitin carboxyl-terminal hydrolase 50 [Stegastes partitus]|uniref:Ubiquitin carboxyl-terminal hydrolase 50 n=1 Tax=Stegastes partitus TaxID=144197 RepID=A0A3B4ZSX3_9TELE|nr:PREDICTED: putative ubiquitin carboxyl-terminal hydrolase 50 [Stegastes partitus]